MEWTSELVGTKYQTWTLSNSRFWSKNKDLLHSAGFRMRCVDDEWRLYFEAEMPIWCPLELDLKRDLILSKIMVQKK